MRESKYEGLINYNTKPLVEPAWIEKAPRDPAAVVSLTHLESNVIPGAFYFNALMILQPTPEYSFNDPPMLHEDWDEVVAFFGTDPTDPSDLGGEVEFTIGDEVHIITKSCSVFLPKGLLHGPLNFKKVTRPIIAASTGNSPEYTQTLPEGWEQLLG